MNIETISEVRRERRTSILSLLPQRLLSHDAAITSRGVLLHYKHYVHFLLPQHASPAPFDPSNSRVPPHHLRIPIKSTLHHPRPSLLASVEPNDLLPLLFDELLHRPRSLGHF